MADSPFVSLGDAADAVVAKLAAKPSSSVEVLTPASREEWLALRHKTVGASEIACLLGAHPYMTPLSLWMAKSEISVSADETSAMRRGRHLESVAIEMLREERPDWIVNANAIPGGRFYRDLDRRISCTPDAFVSAPGRPAGICQIKSVSAAAFRKSWKNEAGEIEPPLYAAVQAIQECALTGMQWACVAALVVDFGIDLHIIEIPVHAGILARLDDATADFWRHVEEERPYDPDYARDGALIAQLYADDNGGTIDLSANNRIVEVVALREKLKEREADGTAAIKERKTLDAEIINFLGNAARGRLADGRIIEAKTVRRAGYVVDPTSYRAVKIKEQRRTS
jgi:predicted phage-related endonuclease